MAVATWLLVAVAAVWYAMGRATPKSGVCVYRSPLSPAGKPSRASFNTSAQKNVSACSFSESYWEARAKFRSLATRAGMELHTLPVVGDMYTMDTAVLPGASEESGVVVHTSGVHGIEGYAGSAIQIAFMEQLIAPNTDDRRPTIVLVHAVNPYGMAHFRRFNEHNVDLNRNALHEDEWASALGRARNVAGYENFDSAMFNPPSPPSLFDAYVGVFCKAIFAIVRHGFVHMKRAIVAGQYHKPSVIYYGGQKLQESHRILKGFLTKRFTGTDKGIVTWIDVHTGLGPSGKDTLMPDVRADSKLSVLKETEAHFPGAFAINHMTSGSGDVAAGYELTMGTVGLFYPRLFSNSRKPIVVTQEFGTLPGIFVARAMILENQAFVYAPETQPTWSEFTRDAFYVRTDAWRTSILDRGLAVLHQAVVRSTAAA